MSKYLSKLAVAALGTFLAGSALAVPVTFTFTPSVLPGGTNVMAIRLFNPAADPTYSAVHGTIATDMTFPISGPVTLSASPPPDDSTKPWSWLTPPVGEFSLEDASFLGGAAAGIGIMANISGGPVDSTGGPGTLNFNIAGFALLLNYGSLAGIDLGASPLGPFMTPNPTDSTMLVTPGAGGTLDLLWTIPLSVSTVVPSGALPFDVPVFITSELQLTGTYVPEPGTMLLVGIGVAGLAAIGRKRGA